jgi:predicted Rossmann fold flavoprotein
MFDILVIGAGAAGYMAAIIAKRENPELKIAILEKTGKVLGKVKISGGGRCNLTHNCLKISELSKAYPRGGRFLKKCFPLWSVQETLDFFNGLGVETYAQEDGRMFPTSNTSETVVDALQNEAKGIGIKVILNQGLNGLEPTDNGWTANTRDQEMTAKWVVSLKNMSITF